MTRNVPPPGLRSLATDTFDRFSRLFGESARHVSAAPGRVNLIGEHIDYNDGHVLPMAIERWMVAAGAPAGDGEPSVAVSSALGEAVIRTGGRVSGPGEPSWANYVRGVVAGFVERGIEVPPFRVVFHGSVPNGAGLSSSAALEVATATFLEALTGTTLDPEEKALLCQEAEHRFAGVPCGIMDQFASVFAREDHLLLLDCRSREIAHVPFDAPDLVVLVANSGVHHALADGEYARRRAQCAEALAILERDSWRDVSVEDVLGARDRMSHVQFRRARHVVTEEARTVAAAGAIAAGEWQKLGGLMRESHVSLRDDYEVSCPELDLLVDLALGCPGVVGSRMTGGGFGGSTVSLVRREAAAAAAEAIAAGYRREIGRDAAVLLTRPAAGATVLPVSALDPSAPSAIPS